MLDTMGFRDSRIVEHSQRHRPVSLADAPYDDVDMYTVVAHRACARGTASDSNERAEHRLELGLGLGPLGVGA